jgi:hypothetical protein
MARRLLIAWVLVLSAYALPAFAEDMGTAVFSESTSFEELVKQRRAYDRGLASASATARVIAVRRELGLTRAEADRAPQDIVLNGGADVGLSEGMSLKVTRKVAVIDPYQANQQKELEIPFARVRVMHVQEGIAIARVEKMEPNATGFALNVRGILIGDTVSSR